MRVPRIQPASPGRDQELHPALEGEAQTGGLPGQAGRDESPPDQPAAPGSSRARSQQAGATQGGRKRRYRPGQRALMEIRKYQSSTDLLLSKAPFGRVVRELCMKYTRGVPLSWQSLAIRALQEAAEAFLVRLLEDSYTCSLHAKRVTLQRSDIQLARRIRGIQGGLG
ncbi:hypothetical protein GDO81_008255 [Engystomops pustulosus]|uniref:Core Histone H2A/H2B/H3 domain-containing protein n=1 Tax=Engystomops pustulosus TaxID=76066 RepID=A0AAV7CDW1_ENGPU|nr:hypothetical protein GDO81_008255 [Engystomops pustulosus]